MERLLALGGVTARSRRTAVAPDSDGDAGVAAIHHLEAGSGPPVVLLHGASGGGANWYRLIEPIARGCTVLAPDLPGFGLSPARPERVPLGGRAAAVVADWLDRLGVGAAVVIGTSFGGLVALRLAQQAPRRVRGLVLIDSVGLGRRLPWVVRLAATPGLARLFLRPSRRGTALVLDRLVTAGPGSIPPRERAALIAFLFAVERAGVAAVLARTLPRFASWRGQREVLTRRELADLTVPVLIAWGGRDRFVPSEHGRRAAAALPDAQFVLIPEAGHSPNWESPARLLEPIETFLRRVHEA